MSRITDETVQYLLNSLLDCRDLDTELVLNTIDDFNADVIDCIDYLKDNEAEINCNSLLEAIYTLALNEVLNDIEDENIKNIIQENTNMYFNYSDTHFTISSFDEDGNEEYNTINSLEDLKEICLNYKIHL